MEVLRTIRSQKRYHAIDADGKGACDASAYKNTSNAFDVRDSIHNLPDGCYPCAICFPEMRDDMMPVSSRVWEERRKENAEKPFMKLIMAQRRL